MQSLECKERGQDKHQTIFYLIPLGLITVYSADNRYKINYTFQITYLLHYLSVTF